jgi:hypothetical protein
MKLYYRGESYEYDPNQARYGNSGRPVRPARTSQEPYTLIYRGATYQIDPTAPVAETPALSGTYELIYRGTTYRVDRATKQIVPVESSSGSLPQLAATSVPHVLPRRYVSKYIAKVHQANLVQNLYRRFQVAQERGDQKLVKLLETELQQIAPGSSFSM